MISGPIFPWFNKDVEYSRRYSYCVLVQTVARCSFDSCIQANSWRSRLKSHDLVASYATLFSRTALGKYHSTDLQNMIEFRHSPKIFLIVDSFMYNLYSWIERGLLPGLYSSSLKSTTYKCWKRRLWMWPPTSLIIDDKSLALLSSPDTAMLSWLHCTRWIWYRCCQSYFQSKGHRLWLSKPGIRIDGHVNIGIRRNIRMRYFYDTPNPEWSATVRKSASAISLGCIDDHWKIACAGFSLRPDPKRFTRTQSRNLNERISR